MADSISLGIRITADGKGAESTINSLNKTIEKVGDSSKKASQSLGGIEKAAQGLGSAATTAGRALAGLGVAFSARSLIQTADAYSGIVAKLKLVSGSAQEFATAQARLFELSQRNMTPLAETVQLYSRLATSMRDLGRSQAETLTITDLVGKSIRISGADASSAAAGILQFSQAIGSGVLRGDEFNSMMENSPRLAKALADGLNVPIGALREMAAQGELTADKVINAILSQSQAIQREYTQMPLTVSGAFQQIQNAFTDYIGKADQAGGSSKELAQAISSLANNFELLMWPVTKTVKGWALIIEGFEKLTARAKALEQFNANRSARGLFGSPSDKELDAINQASAGTGDINQAVTQAELEARKNQQKDFFDGVKRGAEGAAKSYIEAANAAWKLNDAQKAVVATIVKIGEAQGFDPAFLLSIAKAETQLGNMKRLVSPTGAQGIFQFMPGTARAMGVKDPWNLEQATEGAIKYLSKLKAEFKSVGLAAAGYNAGEGAVRKYGNNVPPYKETQTYVRRVLANMQDLQRAMGQSSGDISKELAKANQDQYKSYAEHLKLREKAFDDYTKVELAKQRTQMEQLDAARKAAEDRYKTASAMGDGNAMAQAEAEQMRLIREKQRLLLDSIKIEEQATQKKLGNIGQEIAAAKKLGQYEKVAGLRGERASEQAELAALAERRKQIEITAQGEISKAMRDAEDERRKTMKQTADDAVEMARQSREAQEAELGYLQKQEQFRQQIGEQAAQGAKAAIDSQLQQMEAAVAGQKAERDAQLQNLSGLAQIQQARQNINADLQDQLGLIEAEKQAAQAKLAIDQQMLGYQEQMLQAQLATTSERERRLEIESAIAQIHLQQADNLRAVQNAATQANAAAAKAQSEAAKGMGGLDEKSVKERQLRENAYWDQYMGRLREYAALWKEITGQVNDSFSESMVAMGEWSKNMDQIHKRYQDNPDMFGDMTPFIEGLEQAQAGLSAMAKTMLAIRSNYAEGTKNYKDLTSAAERMMEVQRSMQLVEGVLAVIHQLSAGDVYSAIPRAMGVAAMIASMGVSVNANARSVQKDINTTGTGGGVFGGKADEYSNSIADSLKLIQENTSNDLNYSAAMLRALQSIETALAGVTNQVIRGVGPSSMVVNSGQLGTKGLMGNSGAIGGAVLMGPIGYGIGVIGDAIGKILMNVSKKITGYGIQGLTQSLSQILANGFKGLNFTEVTTTTKVLFMTVSKKVETLYGNLNKDVARQFTLVFQGIADALKAGGEAFDMTGEEVMQRIGNVKLNLGKIDLAGLSGKEIQETLSKAFSKMTDKLAKKLMPGLDEFLQVGESYSKTFFRVAEGINRANGELERLNVNAINYKDILNKQGDPAAEIVRQSLAAQTQLSQSVRDYVNVLTGSAEDIIEAYKQILSASNLLKTAGIGDANLSQTMTNAAGGLSEFVSAMQSFNENFLSEADRYAGDMRVLAEQFGALGYALPDSKESFAAMVRGIDTSTEAGQKLFGQMIALSESFAQVANEAQAIRDKYASILDPFKAISDQIKQVGSDFGKLLGGVVGDSQGRINSIGNAANQQRGTLTARQSELQKEIDSRLTPLFNLYSYADKVQADLDAELAKKPKNQNAKKIKRLQEALNQAKLDIQGIIGMNQVALDEIASINLKIANIDAQEGIDKAAESARLALEKQGIIDDARLAMGKTLEDIFTGLAQTIQQAQQRLQSVLDLQKSLASQIAQLQGPQAVFGLASTDRNNAFGAIDTYINSLADGRARDVGVEVGLLNTAQQAVMAKYNAEIAAIQEAEREYIAAETERLNTALQLQIEAINDALDAQIKAQSKLDAAAQKAMQKQFDAEQKAMQKAHDAQLKALGDELDAANRLRDAIKGIQDYVRGMALGGNSPLSPEQRLAEAQRQYQDLLARAQGGDADAMQKLSGASDAYLEASKQYYGSGTQYANTFDAVKNAMSAIGGMSAPDPDSIQSRIDALREAQADEMDRLRELQAEKLDALREKQQEAIEAMRQSAQKQIEAAQKATQQAIADLSDPNKNAAMRAAREAAERDLGKLAELAELTRIEAAKQAEEAKQKAQEQADAALKMAQDQLDALQAGTRLSAQQLGVLSGILQGMGLQAIPIEGYAKGGFAQAGLALVGEQGPEIVRFERPAQVMTADETRDALRGGNDGKIVQAIAELKAEMRAVVVTQSNANPQIIAELSEMKNRLAKMERTQRFTVGA